MKRWSTWIRGTALLVLAAALACGDADADEGSPSVGVGPRAVWPAGETVSSIHALQVLDVPGLGTVVVDTAAEVDGEHGVEARWDEGGRVVVRDGSRPALIFAWAWMGRGHVHVAGFACPEPALDDFDLLDVDRVAGCGGSEVSYVIRSLEIATRRWSEVEAAIPAIDGRTVDVLVAGGAFAIFGGADEEDASKRVVHRVDLASGSRTIMATGLDGLWICESGGHLLGFRGGEIDVDGSAAPGRFVEVGQDGLRDLDVAFDEPAVMLGCLDDAMVLWLHEARSTVLARYADGAVSRTRREMPMGDGPVHVVAQRNLGGAAAMWESHGTSFDLWQFGEDGWVDCGLHAKGLDPPDVVAVDDCVAIAIDPEGRLSRVGGSG